jgi:DNA-binding response OmpR family regulator
VTPIADAEGRLAALAAGVDEALPPIGIEELAGRLRLATRRVPPSRRVARLPIDDGLELDLGRRELLRDGHRIHLRPKEARLLEVLIRASGRTLTRTHILMRVWGADHQGDPRTVDVHVRWLRAKIEPEPRHPVRLLTVRGVGYRLETPAALTDR